MSAHCDKVPGPRFFDYALFVSGEEVLREVTREVMIEVMIEVMRQV